MLSLSEKDEKMIQRTLYIIFLQLVLSLSEKDEKMIQQFLYIIFSASVIIVWKRWEDDSTNSVRSYNHDGINQFTSARHP